MRRRDGARARPARHPSYLTRVRTCFSSLEHDVIAPLVSGLECGERGCGTSAAE